eukprot:g28276.t1
MCKWLPDWLKTHRWFGIPEEVEQHLHKMEDNGDILRLQDGEEHCQMLKAKCTDIEYDAEVCKEQEVEKRKPLRPQPPRVFSEDDSRGLLVSAWQSASSQRCSNKLAKIW